MWNIPPEAGSCPYFHAILLEKTPISHAGDVHTDLWIIIPSQRCSKMTETRTGIPRDDGFIARLVIRVYPRSYRL
jgi:hypothetical protein